MNETDKCPDPECNAEGFGEHRQPRELISWIAEMEAYEVTEYWWCGRCESWFEVCQYWE